MTRKIGATLFVMSLLLLLVGGSAFAGPSAANNGKVPEGKGKAAGRTDSTEIAVEPASQGSSKETTTAGNPNQNCDGDSGGKSDTGKGANQGDAYDNTCDSPDYDPAPGNGKGNGQRVGIPCTGCLGQADDKNPKGQMPNASDRNNGYECDGNKGIAKGNPAHTTCSPPLTQDNPPKDNPPKDNPPKDNPPKDNPPTSNPPTTQVLGSGTPRPTQVLGVQLSKEPGAAQVLGVAMARTGLPVISVALIALALTGLGVTLMTSPKSLKTTA